MTGKKFRVLLAEGDPGEAAESLRALYPGPGSTLELSIVSTMPTLLAALELAAPETIFLDLSLGKSDRWRPYAVCTEPLQVFHLLFLLISPIKAMPPAACRKARLTIS
jgi:hypothetical protein